MKKTRILNQTTAALLLSSLTLTSCSKNFTTNVYDSADTELSAQRSSSTTSAMADFYAWKKLITSDEKNIALAEILSSTVAKKNRPLVQDVVSLLNPDEISGIIDSVQKERLVLEKSYLFRGNIYLEGRDIYRNSILNNEIKISANSFDSESTQLQMATFTYLKSKALGEIYASFEKVMEDNSRKLAKAMAIEIAESHPVLASELEASALKSNNKEEFSDKLKGSKNYLALADHYFQYSGLSTKEQLVIVSTSMIGGALFLEIKQTKTFADILKKYQELKPSIDEIKKNVNSIKLAVSVIKQNKEEANASLKDFNDGLSGLKNGITETYNTAKEAIKSGDSVNGKKIAQFIYEKVIKGKDLDQSTANESILSAQKKLNDNLKKTFDSASKMANNLDNILNTTENLAKSLGITIPKDLDKALQTAKKISAGVKLASTLISGFASGGVLSAVSLLSSGPLGGMLGLGGGTDPAVMEALGRVEAKLDIVLENQQKMMEMQIQTIKMIKNLAVMIDDYHQNEMRAIADLRDLTLVNLEISKSALNENIRNCEAMIDYKLKTYWGQEDYIQKSKNGNTTTSIDFEKFYSQFNSLESFRKFTKSSSENNFSKCQDAFSEAFGVDTSNESPILSIFATTDNENLFTFQKSKYLPLVKLFDHYYGSNGPNKTILHLPTRQISGLDAKTLELIPLNTRNNENRFSYRLENLLSAKSLERYLSSLLILYPIFELDKGDWDKSLPDLIETYFKRLSPEMTTLNSSDENISRGYYFLNNALDMIHSSIAQEALLSGELIIPKIRNIVGRSLFKNGSCKNATAELLSNEFKNASFAPDDHPFICSLRENKLFMKNYLVYTISKSLPIGKYEEVLRNKDSSTLALYLTNENIDKNMIVNVEGELKVKLLLADGSSYISISLPTVEELKSDVVVYSENMERLLKMQKDTISALVKLSPSKFRSQESREKYAQLLLFRNY